MKCPICDVDLVMSERSGVEIDYCPKCRGIWLDRGELDKIIEKVDGGVSRESGGGRNEESDRSRSQHNEEDQDYRHDSNQRDEYNRPVQKKKRGGFLSDLMDFGGE